MAHATPKPVDDSQALDKTLSAALPELRRLAPQYVNVNRLLALAIEAKMRNSLLAKTSIASVVAFCKRCAEWGTDRVGAGGVWPVPFWNSKTNSYDMTPIPDWRLLIEKAKKAKAITHATAEIVRERDKFSFARGMHPELVHVPALGAQGKIIAAYCLYTLPDGSKDFVVMSWGEIEAIRNRSKAWLTYQKDQTKVSPWNTDEGEMTKKTVVKRAMKLFEGASIELTQLLEADHAVMGFEPLPEPAPITMPVALTSAGEAADGNDSSGAPVDNQQDSQVGRTRAQEIADAVARLGTITSIAELSAFGNASATQRNRWTNEEQTKYRMHFDQRMTELKNQEKQAQRKML